MGTKKARMQSPCPAIFAAKPEKTQSCESRNGAGGASENMSWNDDYLEVGTS